MQRLHTYPDIRAMFRRLLIATVTGALAALAVAVFRHSMYLLEWLLLSNDSGSLVNAAASLSPWRRALTPALGGLVGLCGPLLMWLMDFSHGLFLRLKLSPPWQLALGGAIVGLLSLLTPKVWGNGYSVVQAFLLAPPLLSVIAGVFICKLLAVLASSGSGAPGGVFTPTLFVGMATGMLFAQLFALWLPGSETAILLGLAGMATLLAATTHAPIMSALMVCEMTGQYFLLPGLLVACVVASVLSRTLRHDSIYGQHATEGREIDVLR